MCDSTTKHSPNCKMSFGRKDPTCPRCAELLAGAAPRSGWQRDYFRTKKLAEQSRSQAIKNHDCKRCGCGPVCTAFDW